MNRTFAEAYQSRVDRDEIDRPITIVAHSYPAGWKTAAHWHARSHQLVYASSGVMTVVTEQGMWVVPPQRAVWIPAGVRHDVHAVRPLTMRSVYVQKDVVPWLPTTCSVVNVTPLLRELIMRATEIPPRYPQGGREERAMLLILDEIAALPAAPLHLPEPDDPRLKQITTALKEQPDDRRTLEIWARTVGASSRTLRRLFLRETGMSFQQWQRQARLLASLVRLAEGQSVTAVALDIGYDSPSAFIAMFKGALGVTPRQYFATTS